MPGTIAALALLLAPEPPPPCSIYHQEACTVPLMADMPSPQSMFDVWREMCPTDLDRCSSPQGLVYSRTFQQRLRRFTGRQRVSYIRNNKLLSDQLIETLEEGTGDIRRLPGGFNLYFGCVLHHCTEQGAIVIAPGGTIAALALLVTTSQGRSPGSMRWAMSLEIFVRGNDPVTQRGVRELRAWAYREIDTDWARHRGKRRISPPDPLSTIWVHDLPSHTKRREPLRSGHFR